MCVCVHAQAHKTKKCFKKLNSGSRDVALPNDPSSGPNISGGMQLPLPATPWNPMPSSGIYDHLHTRHTYPQNNMQLLRMRKRRKKKQLLPPNSSECSAIEMHELCFNKVLAREVDFSLPCFLFHCRPDAIESFRMLSNSHPNSLQMLPLTGGKYLISLLSLFGHSSLN